MDVAVIVYGRVAGALVVAGVLLLVDPPQWLRRRPHPRREGPRVVLLGLPPGRPLHERFDYPTGVDGRYAIHAEMRIWSGITYNLGDLAEVAPLIEAAYLPAGVAR